MKKVIIITLLMIILSTLFIGSGVCFADESQANYYYVEKGSELGIRISASDEAMIALYIPSTYAFEYVEKVDGFVKIRYNGYEGYVSDANFNQYCKPVTSKWGDSPYFHTITANVNVDQLPLYDKNTRSASSPIPKSMVSIGKIYGYYHNENGYFFLVEATVTVLTASTEICYIKASDTTLADFNKDTIPENAGYTAEITPDPTPSGNGDGSTPTINPDTSDPSTTPATNNFERYVLIAVIAVLCVVIIILIFAPNKSKRKPQ